MSVLSPRTSVIFQIRTSPCPKLELVLTLCAWSRFHKDLGLVLSWVKTSYSS